jgi:1,2-phenylacetyl-CoA epoxidase catalytic subunit
MATVKTAAAPKALAHLILGLRDCKQILARETTNWSVRAPSLETGIALAAQAQDELGHAQVLAALHGHEFAKGGQRTERVGFHDPVDHPAALPFAPRTQSWPDMVALLYLWDSAIGVILEALAASSLASLRNPVGKMCEEEAKHWIFARGAAADLMARDGRVPEAFREACKAMLPRVQGWFAAIGDMEQLRRDGVVPDAVPMARYASRLGPLLEDMKLTWPAPVVAGGQ